MTILKTNKKNSGAYLPIMFFVWFLVKLGSLGISLVSYLFNSLKNIVSNLSRIFSRDFYFDQPSSKTVTHSIISTKKPKKKLLVKKNNPSKKNTYFKTFRGIFSLKVRLASLLAILVIFFISYSYFLVELTHDMPSPNNLRTLPTPTTTEFYDRNNKLLYRFSEGKNRTPVKLSEIPPHLIQAAISMEDRHFYNHIGIDFAGILRAGVLFIRDGEVQGGSTITQQLIKNTLLTPERTLQRKTKEIILAFWTERIFSKQEILEMYFNEVPFGGTA